MPQATITITLAGNEIIESKFRLKGVKNVETRDYDLVHLFELTDPLRNTKNFFAKFSFGILACAYFTMVLFLLYLARRRDANTLAELPIVIENFLRQNKIDEKNIEYSSNKIIEIIWNNYRDKSPFWFRWIIVRFTASDSTDVFKR